MKKVLVLVLMLSIGSFTGIQAQIGSKLQDKIKKSAENRVEKRIDQGIEKGLDKIEEDLEGTVKGDSQENDARHEKTEEASKAQEQTGNVEKTAQGQSPVLDWAKFDFVPGDKIIFEDEPSDSEENGAFPSRWDLVKGQVEIARFGGESVIAFLSGMPTIIPYIKDADQDYLPEQFTIEFDIYRPAKGNRFFIHLTDKKNQKNLPDQKIEISHERIMIGKIQSTYPGGKNADEGRWIHISLAFTKGNLKVYMDDTRLINIPRYEHNPSGFTLNCYFANSAKQQTWFLKNFRIAEGGVKYYEGALQEGRIIVNGIKFDVNKATLRPESIGPINKIKEMMEKDPELRFSVEGHTDSDGDEAFNQQLSEKRAEAVVAQLITMGISAKRMSAKGWGESKPISGNDTPEGKATNRRVEFIRL